jgi:hypothetical protein
MATAVSNPVLTYVNTLLCTGTGCQYSTFYTATVCLTQGFQTLVPFGVYINTYSSGTGDPIISVHPSADVGASFDSQALYSYSVAGATASTTRGSISLPTGIYAIKMLAVSNTTTFYIYTQQVLTAYITV